MAQAKFIPILKATTGLNNTLDPVRLDFDPKTGVIELSQAVNVDVDNSGRVSRRQGRVLKRAEASRCGFVHGEVCLFVAGGSLYQLHPDYSRIELRSGLTIGARMRYCPVADRIYYINGSEKGYVHNGANFAWTKGEYGTAYQTNRVFFDPPNGHLLGWFGGRMIVARANTLLASEPSFYGVFDLHRSFKLEADRITMLQPTSQGIWVGTSSKVLFYRGSKWEEVKREVKYDFGVLEGSEAWCPGDKLGVSGRVLLFTTPSEVCAGGEDGSLVNLTYKKLTFPTGKYASGTVAGDRYITLIQP